MAMRLTMSDGPKTTARECMLFNKIPLVVTVVAFQLSNQPRSTSIMIDFSACKVFQALEEPEPGSICEALALRGILVEQSAFVAATGSSLRPSLCRQSFFAYCQRDVIRDMMIAVFKGYDRC